MLAGMLSVFYSEFTYVSFNRLEMNDNSRLRNEGRRYVDSRKIRGLVLSPNLTERTGYEREKLFVVLRP